MKRTFRTCLGLALAAGLVIPGAASAQAAAEDSAIGSATDGFLRLAFDARSGPSGESPRGTVTITFPGATNPPPPNVGEVTCLSVSGDQATIGARFFNGGSPILLFVDESEAQVGVRLLLFQPPPTVCPLDPNLAVPPLYPALNLVVTDAQPFPATKDQCKNGGWRTFGVFKNQGDCVSFVATRGKDPPAG